MSFLQKTINWNNRNVSLAACLWFLLSLTAIFIQLSKGPSSFNNYLIFKGLFWHTIHETNLYNLYPSEYFDCNHYGISFSLLIAPFAWLPDYIGCFFWGLANAILLYLAIQKLPLSEQKKNIVLWIALVEMMTAMHNLQFNPMLTAFMLLSWILIEEKKDFWATLFIALGILTKLYGVVALAFFLFSKNKITFIWSFVFWMIAIFCLPMLFSSPGFVLQSYKDWLHSLTEKNNQNTESIMQGISIMRLVKRGLHLPGISDAYFLVLAAIGCGGILFRPGIWTVKKIRLQYLALLFITVVIFSSSAESSTYIIAMIGVAIWFISEDSPTKTEYILLIAAIILTSLSTTDLFPGFIKEHYIRYYALKALPCVLIWFILVYNILASKILIHEKQALNEINF